MSSTYSITDSEFKEYVQNFYKKTFSTKFYWIFGFMVLVVVLLTVYNWSSNESNEDSGNSSNIIGSLLSWVFWIVLLVGLWAFIVKRMGVMSGIKEQDRETVLGERTLTVSTENVKLKSAVGETTLLWNGVKKWEQTPNLYLLYITHNSAHLIPKRVFSTEIERQEFETLLKTKVQNLSDAKYLDA